MVKALQDILVVALEQAVAAPLATARLADAGARVIKLERPEGDFARFYDDAVLGQSSYFVWLNRGKESCRVDLTTEEDRALVARMIAAADVFVQNLAPGAAERLGFGSAALRARHPRLIACDMSGYPAGTPDHARKAYDLLIQAETGLASVTGSADSGPSRVGVSIADIATGHAAHAAILEALFRRERTGAGAHLQLSLFDTVADLMAVPYLTRRYGGREPPRLGLAHPSVAPYGAFRLLDGEIVIAVQNEREWRAFCREVLGDAAMADDPRFSGNVARVANRTALDARIQEALGHQSVAVATALLDRAAIAHGRISDVAGLIAHRSATEVTVGTPSGPVEMPAHPTLVDGARPASSPVPALGQHDEALRREFALARGRSQ